MTFEGTLLTLMVATVAFAVAAHFNTSWRVFVLVDMAIAANISWSIEVVLFRRKFKWLRNKRVSA